MNRIVVIDDQINLEDLSASIEIELMPKNSLFDVNTLTINVLKDSELVIDYKNINESKLNIEVNVFENVRCCINEFRMGVPGKIKYHFNIDSNSILNVCKFYDIDSMKEFVRIDLNGENASINYNFKTISKAYEKYDITIYHNNSNTNSNIINNGVNIIDGSLIFNVSSFVSNGNKKCNAIQKSRIINLTLNTCSICPNLYIDENDINASHSAYVGNFKDDELFYLMSRGINIKEAEYLLIKGFLLNGMIDLVEKINQTCEKYWR